MKHMRRQNEFVNKFADLENYYVDSLLKGELNQLYKGVQLNCSDFRQNVFSKNLELLDSKLSRSRHGHSASYDFRQYESAHEQLLKEIKTPKELLEEYTKKAKEEEIQE